jgi:S-adenosylmethionine hydrolase
MAIITLTTDFGLKDGFVGVMKGVIWEIVPDVHIVDLSHEISPQNVLEGAYIMGRSAPYFPKGTIHVGVIDPGVGTDRRPIAAKLGSQYFVGPDNGLFSFMLARAENNGEEVVIIDTDNPKYWLSEISNVFHGRDIFSPVGAHLAKGVPLEKLGTRIDNPVRLKLLEPEKKGDGWVGQIMHIDHFGNIATNFKHKHLDNMGPVVVQLCGVEIQGLVRTFGERPPGDLIALFGSTGNLVISVVNGNAASRLKAEPGDLVEIFPQK